MIVFSSILLTLTLYFYLNIKKLAKFINIYDRPDSFRKFHKNRIPKIGGIINLFIIVAFLILIKSPLELIFYIVFFTLIAIIDDKFSISPNIRLFFLSLITFMAIFLMNDLIIKNIYFSSIDKSFSLKFFAVPFSIICILLLTNSLNMIDGINGLCSIYKLTTFLIILLYFFFSIKLNLIEDANLDELYFLIKIIIFYIFILAIFIFFNIQNKIFLGDSGVYLSSSILSYILIRGYYISGILNPEIILIILLLPGIDMFRIFCERILNKKNPFLGDRNHLHHLLQKKFNNVKIIFFFIIFLILGNIMINLVNFYSTIISLLLIYVTTIILLKKNKRFI